MEWVMKITNWLQANWGVAVFGGLSLGTVITVAGVNIKTFIASKIQGTKYEQFFLQSKDNLKELKGMYEKSQKDLEKKDKEIDYMHAVQSVMFDGLSSIILSSKLDNEEKRAFVGKMERLKMMNPDELLDKTTEKAEKVLGKAQEVYGNVSEELETKPTATVTNVIKSAGSLLDKYTNKDEEV